MNQVLIENIEQLAPIVYTPTVGVVCQRFGSYFRRARGMYFTSQDRDQVCEYAQLYFNPPRQRAAMVNADEQHGVSLAPR